MNRPAHLPPEFSSLRHQSFRRTSHAQGMGKAFHPISDVALAREVTKRISDGVWVSEGPGMFLLIMFRVSHWPKLQGNIWHKLQPQDGQRQKVFGRNRSEQKFNLGWVPN